MQSQKGKLGHYWNMWKRGLDFRGLCSMQEYRGALFFHVAVIVLLAAVSWFYPAGGIVLCILSGYGVLSLIPFLAMSVRRFHDAGKSGWWTILVFFGIGIVFCFCWGVGVMSAYNALLPSFSVVYGPPPVE